MYIICLSLAFLLGIATLLPFSNIKKWWIRDLDFPRLQIFLVALTLCVVIAVFYLSYSLSYFILCILIAILVYHGQKILPYTPLYKKQVEDADLSDKSEALHFITMNVQKDNRNSHKCISLIKKYSPDVLLLIEVDDWWMTELKDINKKYEYKVSYPTNNTYGMLLLSRIELMDSQVNFVVSEDIPSIHTFLKISEKTIIKLICLHPKPPVPPSLEPKGEKDSHKRDLELLEVAKNVKDIDMPIVVLGDLNDVAWSKTTHQFQTKGGLLDPRQGRGLYNSFHAQYFFLRFPLDHIFISHHFKCKTLSRLEGIQSDHFPISIKLALKQEN